MTADHIHTAMRAAIVVYLVVVQLALVGGCLVVNIARDEWRIGRARRSAGKAARR